MSHEEICPVAWGTGARNGGSSTALLRCRDAVVSVQEINEWSGEEWPTDLESLISFGLTERLAQRVLDAGWDASRARPVSEWTLMAPLSRPDRILGIGLNFRDHAHDLGERVPEAPATFLKPTNALVCSGDRIPVPTASERVTVEAEVALIFAHSAKDIKAHQWREAIWGAMAVLDFTAEDVLRKNPRFLTRAKGYDGFFVVSPWMVPWQGAAFDGHRNIDLMINGELAIRGNTEDMVYSYASLVEWVSQDCTMGATAILSTGTPGARVVRSGDAVEARVDGLYDVQATMI